MGENIVHVGASGNGQVAKICNNMAMAINMAGCAEAFNLAIQQGLDPHAFHGIINSSSGGSWVSGVYGCVPDLVEGSPSNNSYQGGFGNALLLKDIRLAREASGVRRSLLSLYFSFFVIFLSFSIKKEPRSLMISVNCNISAFTLKIL